MPDDNSYVEVPGWNGKFLLGPKHTYWWNEEGQQLKALSGSTSVLKAIGGAKTDNLLNWAVRCATDYLKRALAAGPLKPAQFAIAEVFYIKTRTGSANLGKLEHSYLEKYIKHCIDKFGGVPRIPTKYPSPRILEFATWAVKEEIVFLQTEVPLCDPDLAIAGTPDFIAQKGTEIIIGDLKTGSGIYDRTYFAQMASYYHMYTKWNKGSTKPSLVIVHCPANNPAQPLQTHWSHDVESDWKAFEAALYIHRWLDVFKSPYKRTYKKKTK